MVFELPEAIYSPQLLDMVIYELEEYNQWYRASQISTKVGVASAAKEPNHSQETVLVINAWQKAHKSESVSFDDLLKVLKNLDLPVVHVTLAALPNHLQRTQIVRWFQNLSEPRPLLLFSADRTLGGGVIVRTPNHIYDWSFRQSLEDARSNLAKVVANA